MTTIATVVGEASGDWIASLAIEQMISRDGLAFEGVAGPRLRALGMHTLAHAEELSVMGYVEVLKRLPSLVRLRRRLINHWVQNKPALYFGVDAPDFNLTIERHLKPLGVPTIHMVCPTIWAWRKERVEKIRQSCDHVLCLFPFEPELLHQEGISATYIGHPMASRIPIDINVASYREKLGLSTEALMLAVLPGSRMSEVRLLSPLFISACQHLLLELPGLQFLVPTVNQNTRKAFLRSLPDTLKDKFHLFDGQSHEVLGAADAVLLASGTATLEAMMFKKPMVISYKVPWLTYQIAKRKEFYLPYFGLPNILSQEFVVPELMQDAAKPEALAQALYYQLTDKDNRLSLIDRFTRIHRSLIRDSGALSRQVMLEYL